MTDSATQPKPKIRTKEEFNKYCEEHRTDMLTVQRLIDYLKTCNPNACVLGFETNSNAYIEQFPELPNQYICTIAEDKKRELEHLSGWFRGCEDAEEKIKNEMDEIYRYAKDDDVIIAF